MDNTQVKFEVIDGNLKKTNKTFGYVNPNADNGVLRQLVTGAYVLSKNSVGEIYRLDSTNITNASANADTDTNTNTTLYSTPSIVSTSDFFSTDSATWQTFINTTVTGNSGSLDFTLTIYNADEERVAETSWKVLVADLTDMAAIPGYSFSNFLDAANHFLVNELTTETIGTLKLKNNGLYVETSYDPSETFIELQLTSNKTGGPKEIIQDLYDNADENSKSYFTLTSSYNDFTIDNMIKEG